MAKNTSSRSVRRSAGLQNILTLALFALILGIINYVSFRHYVHKDVSQSQFYALSPKTVSVLKSLDAPVTITTILSDKYRDQIENLLKEYQRIGGKNIVIDKIDPAYDMAQAAALQKRLHFDSTDFLIIFEYQGRTHFVKQEDLFEVNPMNGQLGAFKGEQLFTSAIVSIVEGKPAKVYFTQGHGEHATDNADAANGYGLIAQNLKSENVEIAPLNLATVADVPADAQAVIIAGPSVTFSPIEVQALDKYLANNGRLFLLVDPYVNTGLDELLKKYGMKLEDDLVLYRAMTTTGTEMTVPLAAIYAGGFSAQPITAKFSQANLNLMIQDARSITLDPAVTKTQSLLKTDASAWGWISHGTVPTDPRSLTYNKTTDVAGPVTVAAAYDGGSVPGGDDKSGAGGTRVVVIGSAKFVENDAAEPVGINFFTNTVDWLVKKAAVLDINPKRPQEYGVALSPMSFRTLAWCSLIVIPASAFAIGIFVWFSRRK
jgi:ABC-type uncharacterized transport system involved in gliding motility auxiliary subunit